MSLRYVALIAPRPDPAAAALGARLAAAFAGWTEALRTDGLAVWTCGEGALGHRRLSGAACLVGLDFRPGVGGFDRLAEASWGGYVAFAADPASRTVTVFRDPSGRIECWRLSLDGGEVVFSHLGDVFGLLAGRGGLNWRFIAYYHRQDYAHGEDTFLEAVTEVLPGEELVVGPGAAAKRMRWRPQDWASRPYASLAEAGAGLRQAAEAAVGAWAGRYDRILLDLSGGLDSSVLLGLLRGVADHPEVVAVNWVMAGEDGDERAYARAAAQQHGVRLVEQPVADDHHRLVNPFGRRLLRPKGRILATGYDALGAELARRHGADAFFTGTGGDHLFYDHLPAVAMVDHLRTGGGLAGAVGVAHGLAQLSKSTVWRVAGEALRHQLGRGEGIWEVLDRTNPFLRAEAFDGLSDARYGHPWLLTEDGRTPPAKLRQIANLIELRRHYYRYGRADVSDECFPLVSQPVIEASLRIPSPWFGAGGVQRGLARRVFADLLPEAVRRRRSKGANTTYWVSFLEKRLPVMRELLLDGRLAQQGLLDRAAAEAALTPIALSANPHMLALTACLTSELWIRQMEADLRALATAPETRRFEDLDHAPRDRRTAAGHAA